MNLWCAALGPRHRRQGHYADLCDRHEEMLDEHLRGRLRGAYRPKTRLGRPLERKTYLAVLTEAVKAIAIAEGRWCERAPPA